MSLKDDIEKYTSDTFSSVWSERKGKTVPAPEDIRLSNDAVQLTEATVLYADLSGSTDLVDTETWQVCGEIYKSFLYSAAKLIRHNGGVITSYDGDRVMGIFIGEAQTSNSAKCALQISYVVQEIINPKLKAQYPLFSKTIRHTTGIDFSQIMAARTGVRGGNDIVWIGKAANYAAKLTELKTNYTTWATDRAYQRMNDEAKFGGSPKQNMWVWHSWTEHDGSVIYGSTWRRSI